MFSTVHLLERLLHFNCDARLDRTHGVGDDPAFAGLPEALQKRVVPLRTPLVIEVAALLASLSSTAVPLTEVPPEFRFRLRLFDSVRTGDRTHEVCHKPLHGRAYTAVVEVESHSRSVDRKVLEGMPDECHERARE
jgi:hypothetical protein